MKEKTGSMEKFQNGRALTGGQGVCGEASVHGTRDGDGMRVKLAAYQNGK